MQALVLLSKDSDWLNIMAKCEGAWSLPKHALAQQHLEPLLQDLDSQGALSGKEVALIRHFYRDLLVSTHAHIIAKQACHPDQMKDHAMCLQTSVVCLSASGQCC